MIFFIEKICFCKPFKILLDFQNILLHSPYIYNKVEFSPLHSLLNARLVHF